MQAAHAWAAAHLAPEPDGAAVTAPFSFTYHGEPSSQLLPKWACDRERVELDDQRTQQTLTWTDPDSGLQVRCVGIEYRDFPVVEWTVYSAQHGDCRHADPGEHPSVGRHLATGE